MTREEAIAYGEECLSWNKFSKDMKMYQFIEMAIQALSQEPTSEKELNKAYTFGHNKGVKAYYNEQLCTVELPEAVFEYILSLVPTEETEQEPCDDAISREAVMRLIENKPYDWSNLTERHNMLSEIRKLPPVTQKYGKWIRKHDSIVNAWFWECNKCECGFQHEYNFCPNCGAKMESEE